MTKEITILDEFNPYLKSVELVTVHDEKSLSYATELLSKLNQASDKIEEEKAKVMRPLLDATAAERARWKPIETRLTQAIDPLRRMISTYQTQAVAKAREEEEKIANRVGEGKGHYTPETAVAKIEAIDKPKDMIATDSGVLKFRTVKQFEIIDLKKVPIEYHLPDEVAIRKAMKNGKELPGVRYFETQEPVNFR